MELPVSRGMGDESPPIMDKHQPPIISQLPELSPRDIITLWNNAIEIVADEKKATRHPDAKLVLSAIGAEWTRRGKNGFDPEGFFPWPTTDAPGGRGNIDTQGWPQNGMLSYMGYHVGSTNGRTTKVREAILSQVFEGVLPPSFPINYMNQWGRPGTPARLQKLAETVAAFARNAKRRDDTKLMAAIRDWEKDLEFLCQSYYVGRFHFAWPDTGVD
jgi:hypothetical protein